MTSSKPQSDNPQYLISKGTMIRRAEVGDIGAVVRLAEACSMTAQWPLTAVMTYCVAEEPENALQVKTIFVACAPAETLTGPAFVGRSVQARNVIGFAAFSAITGSDPRECSLENLAVVEAWRRQGIGARLLAAGLLWCRAQHGSSVWLEVRASNRDAIALYERVGFVVSGTRQKYYTQPDEDATEMRKVFDASGC